MSTLLSQISWSNHLAIIFKAKTQKERHFYIELCIKENYFVIEFLDLPSNFKETDLRKGLIQFPS